MRRTIPGAAAALTLVTAAALHPPAAGTADPAPRPRAIGLVAGFPGDRGTLAAPGAPGPRLAALARRLDLDRLIVLDDPVRTHPLFGFASYSLGSWHVLALNSDRCRAAEGCGPGSPMLEWLRQELLKHARARPCTLATWDEPRFDWRSPASADAAVAVAAVRARDLDAAAAGAVTLPADDLPAMDAAPPAPQAAWGEAVRPMFDLLYEYGVEVVVTGGARNYQRWRPMDPRGNPDGERGIAQFVAGTAGPALEDFGAPPRPAHLAMAQSSSAGVLRLNLRDGAWDFEFVSLPGEPSFTDSGYGIGCH